MTARIVFSESADLSDLKSFLERAKRLDDSGIVKFKASGDVLAVYVSPIFSGSLLGGGTTVLGLRTLRLRSEYQIDANFDIASILDRLAKPTVFLDLIPRAASCDCEGEMGRYHATSRWLGKGCKHLAGRT